MKIALWTGFGEVHRAGGVNANFATKTLPTKVASSTPTAIVMQTAIDESDT
jgi:hypothetical protein